MKEDKKKKRFWQLDNPNNTRIFIDYKNRKEPVKFEYIKTHGILKIVYLPILYIWLMVNAFFCFFNIFLFVILDIIINGVPVSEVKVSFDFTELLIQIGIGFGLGLYMFVIPLIVSIIIMKNNKLLRLMPHINYLTSHITFFKTFLPEDVVDNKVEVPLFANVGLDYKATGEFSKYLDKFEIIDHPFSMGVERKKFGIKRKLKPNEYLWKATFYFTQKPKTGELSVKFK